MQIGPWTMTGRLSSGGFAQLYLCRRVLPGGVEKVGVLKMPLPDKVADHNVMTAFAKEAAIAMKLSHDNIVSVFDVGEHNGVPYLVMEFVAGPNLSEFVRTVSRHDDTLSFPMVAHIVREMFYALDHAHERKIAGADQCIVHRDIKPANILLSESGGVLLTDFGIAGAVSVQSSRMTNKGTLPYMAPEHLVDGKASQACDRFGMGAVLWELLETRRFRGKLPVDQLHRAVAMGELPPLTRAGIPDALRELCLGLLAYEPEARPPIAVALDVLERFPPQRSRLAAMVQLYAGEQGSRTGHTHGDFEIPAELERALAIAEAAREPSGGLAEQGTSAKAARETDAPVLMRKPGRRPGTPGLVVAAANQASPPRVLGATGPAQHAFLATGGAEPLPTRQPAPRHESALTTGQVVEPPVRIAATTRLDSFAGIEGRGPVDRGGTAPLTPHNRAHPPTEVALALGSEETGDLCSPEPEATGSERSWPVFVAALLAALGMAGVVGLLLSHSAETPASTETARVVRPEPALEARAVGPSDGELVSLDEASNERPPAVVADPVIPSDPPQTATPTVVPPAALAPPAPVDVASETKEPEARGKPAPRKSTPRKVSVGLRLGFVKFIQVRIDTKTYVMTGDSRANSEIDIKLAPGSHRVRWRFAKDKPWQGQVRYDFAAGVGHVLSFSSKGPRHSEASQ